MAANLYDLAVPGQDRQSNTVQPAAPSGDLTALIKRSARDRHDERDATDFERDNSTLDAGSESLRQQKTAKIPPRKRMLAAAARLFLKHGIGGASVEAIVEAAATSKTTFYHHFVSKDELVAEYLRESAKHIDAYWEKIGIPRTASAPLELSAWLAEMADGLINGWACRLTYAAAELKQKSHPARRVIKAYNIHQRRRLTRLCSTAGLRSPSLLADALLLLFDGACIMAPIASRAGISSRFVLLGEAMIAAQSKAFMAGTGSKP